MESADQSVVDLRGILQVLWRHKLVIIVLTLGVGVGVFVFSASRPDKYRATAEVQITNAENDLSSSSNRGADLQRLANTQSHLIQSRSEIRRAVEEDIGTESMAAIDSLSVGSLAGTDILRITVTSEDPEVAAAAANAYADAYVDVRKASITEGFGSKAQDLRSQAQAVADQVAGIGLDLLDPELSEVERATAEMKRESLMEQQSEFERRANEYDLDAVLRSSSVTVTEQARPPRLPFEPKPIRDGIVGAIIGLVLGLMIAFARERLDNRIGDPEDVRALTGGLPVLGTIPPDGTTGWFKRGLPHGPRHLVPLESRGAEAFREMQTNLRFGALAQGHRVFAVTSASEGEGKTTVTANLAMVLAGSGMRVAVISGDLRRPTISSIFSKSDGDDGLTTALLGDAPLKECIVPADLPNGRRIALLPAGPLPGDPGELLGSEAFGSLITTLRGTLDVDFVLIDCPPVLPVTDSLSISRHVDGVIMVAVAERTRSDALVTAIDRFRNIGTDVVGVVLNGVPNRGSRYRNYNYSSYGYRPRKGHGKGEKPPLVSPLVDPVRNGNGSGAPTGPGVPGEPITH